MEARKLSTSESSPFELSLRIRHPDMDPAEISNTLQFEPEHCFRAGEARSSAGSATHHKHSQTYWLAPIVVAELKWDELSEGPAAQAAQFETTRERLGGVRGKFSQMSLEGQLFALLVRLNAHHEFVQKLRSGGGDVSILVAVARDGVSSFTLSESIARFLAKLGIEMEFEFAVDE